MAPATGSILTGQSLATESREAARELHAALAQPDASLVLFFCSPAYDLEDLADELRLLFGDVPLVGCTTAGEIGPSGYRQQSLSGASLGAGACRAGIRQIEGLSGFQLAGVRDLVDELRTEVAPASEREKMFALLLIDGLSMREEIVTRALQNALGPIPLVGGSAGDGLTFGETHVFAAGGFSTDSAALVLVATALPFRTFKTQHFAPTEKRVVVTAADLEQRIISEIDGRPAAPTYAELVGADLDQLGPDSFAAHPMVVMIDGTDHVRSIQQINEDDSLTLYCAIDEGVVLRVAECGDILEQTREAFAGLRNEIGEPQLVIACDCILRRLEIEQRGVTGEMAALLRDNHAVGFSTYGEQYRGVHVNQTLAGIAIGQAGGA